MKKPLKICLILVIIFLISLIYFSLKENKTTCTFESNQKDYQISTKYIIYSKKNLVTKIKSKSIIKSSNDKVLKDMKKNINNQYKTLDKKYSGYNYKLKIIRNKLYIKVNINYNKYDMKMFIYDNRAMKEFVNDKKQYTLKGAKKYYKSIGSTCK